MPRCLEHNDQCEGPVEFRHPLSSTGKSFPRCDFHWEKRLKKQEEFNERERKARLVDYFDAGERYDEDY